MSKWETGDAEPEIGKLRLLAAEFGVSVDWLLSEAAPPDAAEFSSPEPEAPRQNAAAEVLDALPGFLGKMLKKFGWLYGVYLALAGAGLTLIGGLARYLSKPMVSGLENAFNQMSGPAYSSGVSIYDAAGNLITDPNLIKQFSDAAGLSPQTAPSITVSNPVATFGGVIMVLGILLMAAGVTLAVWLRNKSKQ